MQVGDRVMVKGGHRFYPNEYGRIVRLRDTEPAYEVRIDGMDADESFPFAAENILPVEVVVLEGEQRWDERGCRWYIGDTSIDDHLDNNGDTVRITIERVKKEG